MITRQLTEAEIQTLLQLPDPNDRKSGYQAIGINLLAQHQRMLWSWATRLGKGWTCRQLCLRIRQRTQEPINVVLWSNTIKEEWEQYLTGIPNVRFFLMAGYSGDNLPPELYSCYALLVDEVHHVLNRDAKRFSSILRRTTSRIVLGLSATIDSDQKAFLEAHGIQCEFHIPLKTGVRLGVLPSFQNLNVPISLTASEAAKYRKIETELVDSLRIFQIASPSKPEALAMLCGLPNHPNRNQAITATASQLNMGINQVLGKAIAYRNRVTARSQLIAKAVNKKVVTLELLRGLPRQKIIVFGSLLAIGDELAQSFPDLQVYRRKVSSKADQKAFQDLMDRFYQNQKPVLYGCKALNEGFTVNDCSLGINIGIQSKQLVHIQRTGRFLGLDPTNPDKMGTLINLFVDDINGPDGPIMSQERRWLVNAQFKQPFCSWLNGVEQLADYLPILNAVNP